LTSTSSLSVSTTTTWVDDAAKSLTDRIQQIGQQDPYSFVAPVSDLERMAANGASKLGGGDPKAIGGADWYADLMGRAAPSVSAASLLDNLNAYMSPYRDMVTNAQMADFDADAGRTRASQTLQMAQQGAFGGSGAALTRSLTEGELARARNAQLSKSLADMFNTGAALSNQDSDRRQQAAVSNAQLAQQHNQWLGQLAADRQANERANLATQAALGQQMRAADQTYREAPLTALAKQVDMFSGLPLSLFHGQITDTAGRTSSTQRTSGLDSSDVAQAAQIAAMII